MKWVIGAMSVNKALLASYHHLWLLLFWGMLNMETNDVYTHTPPFIAEHILCLRRNFINMISCHLLPKSQLHRKMYSVCSLWCFYECMCALNLFIFMCLLTTPNSPVCQSACRCTAGPGWTACPSIRGFLPRLQSPFHRAQLDGWDSQSSPRSAGKHQKTVKKKDFNMHTNDCLNPSTTSTGPDRLRTLTSRLCSLAWGHWMFYFKCNVLIWHWLCHLSNLLKNVYLSMFKKRKKYLKFSKC